MNPRLPRFPGLHLPSILGRAWVDKGPLLLAGVVVALATLLASAVPQTMVKTADDAVNDSVARAGLDASIVVNSPFEREEGLNGLRSRPARTVEIVDDSATVAQSRMDPGLAAVLRPPVAAVTSAPLTVSGHGPGRSFQLTYIAGREGTGVVWTAGGPPKSSVPEAESARVVRTSSMTWPVQIGLSEETAAELGLGPGDRIQAETRDRQQVDIRVSGIFRALKPQDPAWQVDPEVLRPLIGADGTGTRIDLAGLMSEDSLPDGRLALPETDMTRTVTFVPQASALRWHNVEALTTAVMALKASSGTSSPPNEFRWESRLDTVLLDVRNQVLAASAQASVLLVGLIATAILVLLLAADLLVRRRAVVLAGARMRGASLVGIGAELVIEATAVTLAGGIVGLLLGRLLAGGYSWAWLAPIALVAVLGGPVLGTRAAARATRGRQAPANRSARRSALRTKQLRRTTLEAAVLLAAVGAFVALRQRGIVPADSGGVGGSADSAGSAGLDDGGGNILQAIAPTLGAATGALVLLRLLPLGIQLALTRAARSRRSLPLFAAARAAATAARPLPFVILIMSSALLTFALAVSTTESDGQADGAWRAVGADARLDVTPAASVHALAQRISGSDGVDQAVAARVADNVMAVSDSTVLYFRLVVVDPAEFQKLLASTPLPDAPQLARLKQTGGQVPALLRISDSTVQGKNLAVRWNEKNINLAAVGMAPTIGDGERNILIVDATTFAAAGADADPNTVWVTGPRAPEAIAAIAKPDDVVTQRKDVLEARKSTPLAAGLLRLANASIGVLLLWGVLSAILGAAASAPARGEMLARLRTLGLRSSDSRRVAAGELLPPVIVGAVGGLALGVLLAHASVGLLALRLLTGQATDPALVVPWVSAIPVLMLIGAVGVIVAVESSLRRRERLGQILRAGNQ